MIIFIDGTLVVVWENRGESCNLNVLLCILKLNRRWFSTAITLKPISVLKIEEAPSTHPINLKSFQPISMLVALAAQPKDAITSLRLIVSKNYWCRSCGGGAKTEAANWIVTEALLCHTVLPLHWLPSRPLITRMNGINLTIQWSGNGTFRHSCIWVRSGLRGVKSRPKNWMQLTRWSVRSCSIFWMKKLKSLVSKLCILILNLFGFSVDPQRRTPWIPASQNISPHRQRRRHHIQYCTCPRGFHPSGEAWKHGENHVSRVLQYLSRK